MQHYQSEHQTNEATNEALDGERTTNVWQDCEKNRIHRCAKKFSLLADPVDQSGESASTDQAIVQLDVLWRIFQVEREAHPGMQERKQPYA
jgi:hypothetical protein